MKKFMQNIFNTNILKINFLVFISLLTINANARIKPVTRIDIVDNMHFYVGGGVGYSFYNLNNEFEYKVEFSNKGSIERHSVEIFGPIIGIKFQDRYGFGAELGYSFHEPLNIKGSNKGKLTIRNNFLDFMNYIPIATQVDKIKVEILAGFGIGHMAIREYGSVRAVGEDDSYKKYGLRGKAGMQYNIDSSWSIRGLAVYQRVGPRSGLNSINSVKSVSIDIIYVI